MKKILKNPILHIVVLVTVSIFVVYFIRNSSYLLQENIKTSVKNSTEIYFDNIINTRRWNASFGGVYVKANGKIEPNVYLQDNHTYTKDNELLIKINPAWMTRQLSEQTQNKLYSFKIVSQNPVNINNKAVDFDDKALSYLSSNMDKTNYSEFDTSSKKFKYLGRLIVEESCLKCHSFQNYKVGDIRGGISIHKDISNEVQEIQDIQTKANITTIVVIVLTFLMSYLIYKIFGSNKTLEAEVRKRTKRLEEERKYLQIIKDSNKDIMVITNGDKLLDANLAFCKFFDITNIEDFLKQYNCICDKFEKIDDEEYITGRYINNQKWTKYIIEHKETMHKALIKKDKEEYVFLLTAQYMLDDEETNILVVLSDVTALEKSKNRFEYLASVDTLTKIMNRAKFNIVMAEEIVLAKENNTPLSILFFDIDHFKYVNDTFGHDVGDIILIELSNLVKANIRKDDFFARWGGEEFVIIVQEDAKLAYNLAEKLREIIEQNHFTKTDKLTCSFGVTQLIKDDDSETLIKRSDDALYTSKENGRNRVTLL